MKPRMEMRNMTREEEARFDDMEEELDPLVKSQMELQKVLDKMERVDAFLDHTSDALMCKICCMPCYDGTFHKRRATEACGGGVICTDCLCPGN